MEYIENSEAICGYKARVWTRGAFTVVGYTLVVAPGDDAAVPRFWAEVVGDGRLEALRAASSVAPWVLGLSSWDSECETRGFRYTICIEQTEHTDFSALAAEEELFSMDVGASDWLCFQMQQCVFPARFWQDNPYAMMKLLGYRFNAKGGNVGLHFDAYPPGSSVGDPNAPMEFWITVLRR